MESQPPPIPLPVPPSSLPARLMNALVAPGELFDELKAAPYQAANWVVPWLIGAVVGLVFVLVAFSQPAVMDDIFKLQEQAIEQQVKAGKLTEVQAEKAQEQMEGMRPMIATWTKVAGSVAAVLGGLFMLAATAAVLWAIARWAFKMPIPYGKWMEVAGLSGLIMSVGSLATLCLVLIKGSVSVTVGPALLFPDLRAGSAAQAFLNLFGVFNLWFAAVLALGLARLTGRTYVVGAAWVFGVYFALGLLGVGVAALRG